MANERLEQKAKEGKPYVVALPLTGVDVSGYYSMDKTGVTTAYSERQAVTHLIARQKRDTGLIMNQLDEQFGGAERFAIEVPDVEYDDGSPMSPTTEQIIREMYIADFLSKLRGGNPKAYFRQAEKILRSLR